MDCHPDVMPDQLLPRCPQSEAVRRARETGRLGAVVQEIIAPLFRDGYPDVHSVATMLGLGVRTLQRRLSDEGVTYARVVARARFDVAQQMLEDPACKVIEVALDLGYSDQAHFTRAFTRWTGFAPREFQRIRASGSPARRRRFLWPVSHPSSRRTGGKSNASRARVDHVRPAVREPGAARRLLAADHRRAGCT